MRRIVNVSPSLIKTHKVRLSKAYEYAKAMERGDCFPPVWIYKTNEPGYTYKCKNGAHRIAASKMLNKEVKCMVWVED